MSNEQAPSAPNVVVVSSAQVWSAAAQNIVIALIVGGLMLAGVVDKNFGLIALSAISGVDLFGRMWAKGSGAAALALGSTGLLGHFPQLAVALALGSALIGGCAAPCTGLAAGDDILVTARHCLADVRTVAGKIGRPPVHVGDELTVRSNPLVGSACTGERSGAVVELQDNRAIITAPACGGDSGSPVYDSDGNLVGLLVAMELETGRAVVELL